MSAKIILVLVVSLIGLIALSPTHETVEPLSAPPGSAIDKHAAAGAESQHVHRTLDHPRSPKESQLRPPRPFLKAFRRGLPGGRANSQDDYQCQRPTRAP